MYTNRQEKKNTKMGIQPFSLRGYPPLPNFILSTQVIGSK